MAYQRALLEHSSPYVPVNNGWTDTALSVDRCGCTGVRGACEEVNVLPSGDTGADLLISVGLHAVTGPSKAGSRDEDSCVDAAVCASTSNIGFSVAEIGPAVAGSLAGVNASDGLG